ncbi:hypothetical protein C8F04DRAFT_1199100 [Mycena alexandri]|uniref:Uncharacterized protein n=1 Tax=Mycena alexandri TaxID=1745969 RepID=A0AAD6RZ97_9AGAR|nr:hypothetical protein C8F04DRAFT_1199100 [Mycena alexandri]
MSGNNNNSDSPSKAQNTQRSGPPPSRSAAARRLAQAKFREKNEDLLRDKARERMARRRLREQEDSELAAAAKAQRRVHDASYRKKHAKKIKFKAHIRRDDEYWHQHRAHRPDREVRDYQTEMEILEEERWRKAMPSHCRQGASRAIFFCGSVPPHHRGASTPPWPNLPMHVTSNNQSGGVPSYLCSSMSTPDYYCYPTFHNDPIWNVSNAPGVWLVSSPNALAPGPGVYTSWEACSAVCEGVSDAGAVFYNSDVEAYAAWHQHCRLGEHQHPAEPQTPTRAAERPANSSKIFDRLHFAVRGGETIYTDLAAAFIHYEQVSEGGAAELLATDNYMKALYFARGSNEWTAERLARDVSAETANSSVVAATPHTTGGMVYPVSPVRAHVTSPIRADATPRVAVELPGGPSTKQGGKAVRLAAIKAAEEEKSNGKAIRLAAIEAEMRKKNTRLAVIHKYLELTPSKLSSPSKLLSTPSKPAASSPSTPSKPAASSSKGEKVTIARSPSKAVVIGGRAHSKAPADGNESDGLYETLDLDEELAEILSDWVDPDYRYDPQTENGPHDA